MEHWIDEEMPWRLGQSRPPRRRPLVGIALAVVAGTATGLCVPVPAPWLWGAGAALVLPLFVWVRRPGSVGPLLAALFLLVAAQARMSVAGRSASSLSAVLGRPTEYVQFVAVAQEDAALRQAQVGQPPGAVFLAQVEGLDRDGNWQRVHDGIRVVLRGARKSGRWPRYGERWRLRGMVRPGVVRREGLFALPQNQAIVDSDRAFFLDAGQGNPVVAWCMERRRVCREILARGLEDFPDQRGVIQSLLMGYREDLPKPLRKDFAATGTVHIFAISGAHVAMVTVLISGLLRALRQPMTRWFPILAPLLVLYTVTTGAATSAIRSCVMAVLMLAASFLRRRPDSISALAAAAVAILVAAPAQLGDLGFLLSFTAVAGLLAIPPVMNAWAQAWFRHDEWQLPGEEVPRNRRLRAAGLHAAQYVGVTVGAWIATTPLTAYFFNLFSPVALAMNLLVIPSAFVIMLAGFMSLISAPLGAGQLSLVFNQAACAVASFLTWCIDRAAAAPGGHWFVPTPPGAGILAAYAILLATTVMARRVRGALPAGLALFVALTAAWSLAETRRCRVAVLDVGEGSAVLVKAGREMTLVDTGSEYRAEETLRLLRREGVNRLGAMVLTHADAQHVGATSRLLAQIPVAELWVPAVLWPSPTVKEILDLAAGQGIPVRRLRAGDGGDWPGNMVWEVLWPPNPLEPGCADDAALVLHVARFGVALLLAGDAGQDAERAMRQTAPSVAASILVAGRHGDAAATSAEWLAAVRPNDVLISAGPHADSRHPDEEVLARLAQRGIRVWRTDRDGTLGVDLANAPPRWPARGYSIRAVP